MLCAVPLAEASEKTGRNITDANWNQTHPRVNAYYKAFKEKRWSDAAAIIRTWDISNEYYTIYEEYAQVFDGLGDKETALRHMDTRLRFCFTRKEEIKPLEEIRRLASYAQERGLRSSIPIAAALQRHLSGESDIAFALLQNLDSTETYAEHVPHLLMEIAQAAFQAAHKRDDSAAAAAITAYILGKGLPLYDQAQAMAEACEKAGDKALVLQLLEYKIDLRGTPEARKMSLAKEAKEYALFNFLKPGHWLVQLYVESGKGNGLKQLAELDAFLRANKDSRDTERSLKLAYVRELLPTMIETTYLNSAYDKTIACCAYLEWLPDPPDGKLLNTIINAYDLGGKPELAIQLCAKYTWSYSGNKVRDCDPQGDPSLIRNGAAIANKHKLKTGVPLMDAWLAYKQDKGPGSLKPLYQLALANELNEPRAFYADDRHIEPNFEEASACALASFLCADAHLERGDAWRALFWYQRATYLVSEIMSGSPKNSQEDSHFHEVLGVAKQAQVLAMIGKPDTAEAELKGLLEADTSLKTQVLERNSMLMKEWGIAEWEIRKARKNPYKAHSPEQEAVQKQDLIDSPIEDGFVPRKTATAMIPQIRASKKYTVAKAEARERSRVTNEGGAGRFMESIYAQEREARLIIVRSEEPNGGGNFNFQAEMDRNKQGNRQRRCASCLGSGRANYVTGGRYYAVDSHGVATNNQVAAPNCSHCNGTGWR